VNRDRLRRLVVDWTPPALLPTIRRLARRAPSAPPEWELVPEGWARGTEGLRGWDDPSVLEAYRTKLDDFRATLAGTGPFAYTSSAELELGSPTVGEQSLILTFAYALLQVGRGRERVTVLDWGGGLGAYAAVARAVLPAEVELDYHCKEVPRIAEYGRRAVPEVTFWDDDSCLDRRCYDLVVANSSLQYVEDWQPTLARFAAATNDALLLGRVPVVQHHASFVVLQRAHSYRFETEYLGWVFNERDLVDVVAAAGLHLEREFVVGFRPDVVGAPEQDESWSYLFRRDERSAPDP
jgi:putative methyltransferase (TIGR04325 family)